jgi:hypothetical protein
MAQNFVLIGRLCFEYTRFGSSESFVGRMTDPYHCHALPFRQETTVNLLTITISFLRKNIYIYCALTTVTCKQYVANAGYSMVKEENQKFTDFGQAVSRLSP